MSEFNLKEDVSSVLNPLEDRSDAKKPRVNNFSFQKNSLHLSISLGMSDINDVINFLFNLVADQSHIIAQIYTIIQVSKIQASYQDLKDRGLLELISQ